MEKFIRVQFYPRHLVRDGSIAADKLKSCFTYIRLDAFLQIDDPEPLTVYHDKWINNEHKQTTQELQMSHCYLSRAIGLGLTGVSTDLYLTEDSYKDLMFALGLSTQRIEPKEYQIG